jgi:hypothetical protein
MSILKFPAGVSGGHTRLDAERFGSRFHGDGIFRPPGLLGFPP